MTIDSYLVYQLLRPEFKTFLDHESKIITLVNDVADVLEQAAAGPLHTPALYSCFLRALVSARTDPQPSSSAATKTELQFAQTDDDGAQENHPPASMGGHNGNGMFLGGAGDALSEFQFDSEMGPVADISTFPPTMAPQHSEDHLGMLTMDSILSASFWDSVLVPGELSFLYVVKILC